MKKRFKNASQKWMQRLTASYIKQFPSNSNFSSLTDKLQLGTEISGAFSVFGLINLTKKSEDGGYKQMSAWLVRDFIPIIRAVQELKDD